MHSFVFLALQLVLIPLGDGGLYFKQLKLHLNLYTAPAFASILIAIFNVILIVVWYKEYRIDIYQDHEKKDRLFNFSKYSYRHYVKVFKYGVFSGRYFPFSDQKKLRIWTLFTL